MQVQKDSYSSGPTWGFAILFGLLVAGMRESFEGFVVGALLGALAAQVMQLRDRSSKLEKKLQLLHSTLAKAAQTASPVEPSAPTVEIPKVTPRVPIEPVAMVKVPAPTVGEPVDLPAAPPVTAPPQHRKPPEPTWVDDLISGAVDWLKRGNPVARIGIVILFFGGAFLASTPQRTVCFRSSCGSSRLRWVPLHC